MARAWLWLGLGHNGGSEGLRARALRAVLPFGGLGHFGRQVRARRLGFSRRLGRSPPLRARSLRSLRALRCSPSSPPRLPPLACSLPPFAALPPPLYSAALAALPPPLYSAALAALPPPLYSAALAALPPQPFRASVVPEP